MSSIIKAAHEVAELRKAGRVDEAMDKALDALVAATGRNYPELPTSIEFIDHGMSFLVDGVNFPYYTNSFSVSEAPKLPSVITVTIPVDSNRISIGK